MIFRIEIESILNRAKDVFKIDNIKNNLKLITTFFDNLKKPLISKSTEWNDLDILSSDRYNSFLTSVERDLSLIYESQKDIREKMLIGWNSVEQLKLDSFDIINTESKYDDDYIGVYPKASEFQNITPGVKNTVSKLSSLKTDPIVVTKSSVPDIKIYHGKEYGIWLENEINNEDGLRPENRNSDILSDNKDTFYEIEATTLTEETPNIISSQKVDNSDITLSMTIKYVFENPQVINYLYIKPHSFASGIYYKLTSIIASDGENEAPVKLDNIVIDKEMTLSIQTPYQYISSLVLTFEQSTGYFQKYSVANFIFNNRKYKIDFTGPVLMDAAIKYNNPLEYIKYKIETLDLWILEIWKPKLLFNKLPKFNKNIGDDGFEIIESNASKRKRWAIGIEDIDLGENIFEPISEKVTKPISIPDNTKAIQMTTKSASNSKILYYISFNDGIYWQPIMPSSGVQIDNNDADIPKKIYINSDMLIDIKKTYPGGLDSFINTDSKEIRLKAVLIKNEYTPEVITMEAEFLNYE